MGGKLALLLIRHLSVTVSLRAKVCGILGHVQKMSFPKNLSGKEKAKNYSKTQ
jgi:hypothetical protein